MYNSKILLLLIGCLVWITGYSQLYQLPNENSILSFQTTKGKRVSICIDKKQNYLVYRFGTAKKVELEFPKVKDKSSFNQFEYSSYLRGGGIQNEGMELEYLAFTNEGVKYVVYDTYAARGNKYNIGIKVIDVVTEKTTNIPGRYKSRKGSLGILGEMKLVKKGDELYD